MSKWLYMVCPTDFLEPIIYLSSDELNYFYSSLGNNLALDKKTLEKIASTIKKEGISEIIFVLSENNRIVLDALCNQNLKKLRGLNLSYNKLSLLKKQTSIFWGNDHIKTIFISYFLNEKISQLKSSLDQYLKNLPGIKGKIFSKSTDCFRAIYPELVCIDTLNFN